MSVLASAIMDQAAALLNDPSKTNFTYAKQLPHLKSALNKLQMFLQMNGALVLKDTSATVNVDANAAIITPPSDLVSVIEIKERRRNSVDGWEDTIEVDELPEMDPVDEIEYWMWEEETIKITAPTTDREVKIHYRKSIAAINSENSTISILNSTEYLAFRTAALCARFIGENVTRADSLDIQANEVLALLLNIDTKTKQNYGIRPRGYGEKKGGGGFFVR